jgi:hypothetical protein
MNINIELKIKMQDGKEVVLNTEEAKELLAKLREVFPEMVYIPTQPIIIHEPSGRRWWDQPWYSISGNTCISTKSE